MVSMSKIAAFLSCMIMGSSMISFGAQALPGSPAPASLGVPQVMPVRGLCGLGRHRGPYGGCVLNGVPYGYVAPVVVAPYAAPVVVVPRAVCPYGYYYYPAYGRCVPS
jgi:hypothetical protein